VSDDGWGRSSARPWTMAVNGCPICLEKQRRIDDLEEEVKLLRAALGRQQRKAQEGFFGSSMPLDVERVSGP